MTSASSSRAASSSALDDTYAHLATRVRPVYLRLGLLPAPIVDAPIVAAACARDEEEAARLLEALAQAHLIEETTAPGRYLMHDPVCQHAHRLAQHDLTPEERGQTLRRLVDWCLHRASAAMALLTPSHVGMVRTYRHEPTTPPPFTDDAGALAWLASHHEVLMAAVHAAVEAGWHAACWQLVDAMWPLFLLRPLHESWAETHQIGLASARAALDQAAEVRMLTSGAVGLYSTGRHQDALTWYTRALTLAQESGHQRDQAQALTGLARCCCGLGRLEEAEDYHRQELALRVALDDRRGVALATISLGEIVLAQDHYQQAAALLATAHEKLLAAGDHDDAAPARALYGYALAMSGSHDGLAHLHEALDAFTKADSTYWQARTLNMLAQVTPQTDPAAAKYDQQAQALMLTLSPTEGHQVAERLHGPTGPGGDA